MQQRERLVAAVVVLLTGPAAAQMIEPDSGCVLFGELVRRSVVHEIQPEFGGEAYPGTQPSVDFNGLQACASAAPVASWAFASAFSQFGVDVRWSYLPAADTMTCVSSDITNCHPFADPMAAPLTTSEQALIGSSWEQTRETVLATMPFGAASNVSYFDQGSFAGGAAAGPLQPGSGSIGGGY